VRGGVWFGVVELGFGGFGLVGAVAEVEGFGGGCEGEYEGAGVCMEGRCDTDVAGEVGGEREGSVGSQGGEHDGRRGRRVMGRGKRVR
jgi:hypothetical protein